MIADLDALTPPEDDAERYYYEKGYTMTLKELKAEARAQAEERGHWLPRFEQYPPRPTPTELAVYARRGQEPPKPTIYRARCPLCFALAIIMLGDKQQATGGTALGGDCKRNIYASREEWWKSHHAAEIEEDVEA